MSLRTVTVITETCIRCGGAAGPEVIPGDTVKLWLDKDANPAFPEWVEGTIVTVTPQTVASTGPRSYLIEYNTDGLLGSAAFIRDCDVTMPTCVGCCAIINEYLQLMAGVNVPHVSLSYKWNSNGTITLTAHAYSTQIAGVPGEQVTISTYLFKNPSEVPIAASGGQTDTRTITPADSGQTEWAGGSYSVQVTDSEGLVNVTSVWVAPKPRIRRVAVVLLQNQTTVGVTLATGEKIVSIMAGRSDGGFYQFAPTLANPAIIEASAAPDDDNLELFVLIYTP